jgi:hypothetical protein
VGVGESNEEMTNVGKGEYIEANACNCFSQVSFANAMRSTHKPVVPTTPARAARFAQVAIISQLAPRGPARNL